MTTAEALEHEFMMALSPYLSGSYGLSLTGLGDVITPSGDLSALLKCTEDGWSGMLPGESGNLLDFKVSKMYSTSIAGSSGVIGSGGPPLDFQPYGDTDCDTYLVLCEECGITFAKLHGEDFVLCRECDKKPKKYTSQSSHERRIILD